MKYRKHLFICTNEKETGKKCCGQNQGMELVKLFKSLIAERGLTGEVRAQRTGCLDVCADGPAMVLYPEGVFYGRVRPEDVSQLFENLIINDELVERLKLKF
jgi:(2Fe-2S) ferredoxin